MTSLSILHPLRHTVRLLLAAALLAGLVLTLAPSPTARAAGEFADIGASLPGVNAGAVAWGDYDNDGDLDILLTGDADSGRIARVYRNDGGSFSDIAAGLPGVNAAAVAWGDYDNDGDLDILLAGDTGSEVITRVYRNDGGAFTDTATGLPGVNRGAVAWGDYDNDGDLDLLLAGESGSDPITRVYRNDGGAFTDIGAGLPGVFYGTAVAWVDYDSDGDLDIFLAGVDGHVHVARVYRNDGGAFSDIASGLQGVQHAAVAWGDYDNDGDLDILLTGWDGHGPSARVYRNDGDSFTDIAAGLPGVYFSTAAWGDYDNDGDLDILLAGDTGSGYIAGVYRNDGGAFSDITAGLPGVRFSTAAWGDYDNDGDLDILLAGNTGSGYITRVYRNTCATANTPPGAPTDLVATMAADGYTATLSWQAAVDDHTPAGSLSYNLRAGTTPGGSDLIAPMAAGSGWRRLPALGNAQAGLSARLDLGHLASGTTVYWSVQAVDSAWQGGPFAAEGSLVVTSLFTNIGSGLPGIQGAAAWGDYDNDDDLDILLAGDIGSGYIARVYRNDGGTFTDLGAPLPGVAGGDVEWVDYDNDGDLDIFLVGWESSGARTARVYRNDGGGTFVDTDAGLPGTGYAAAAWGDCDNDGDLDILITGNTHDGNIARVYRNDEGAFTDINVGLPGINLGAVAWGDYDNDGDLDILLAGLTTSDLIARVYRNDGGAFTDIGAGLPGLYGSVAWGDYDNDGDLDILLAGSTGSGRIASVYRNDGGTFSDIAAALPGVEGRAVAWGDYDNDGDLDILLAGLTLTTSDAIARVYRNDGGAFTDIGAGLPGARFHSAGAWGDYDGDGDLDILLAGDTGHGFIARVYRNNCAVANTPPGAPTGLAATVEPGTGIIHLSWLAATDDHTLASGLSYNLRLGTTPGGSDVFSSMAAGSGWRRLPALGNAQERLTTRLDLGHLAPATTVYWSVQAIDSAFQGGAFGTEGQFETGYAALTLTKSDGLTTWYAAWNQTYTLVVRSTGTISATNVIVTDTLPAPMYPVSLPPGAVQNSDGSLTWQLGDLDPGASRTLLLTARTLSMQRGPVTNAAVASARHAVPVTASDTTDIVAPPTATPGATLTHAPTATPSATLTHTPTATPSATLTHTPMATPSATLTHTPTPTPSATPNATATSTPTPAPGDLVLSGLVYVETAADGRPARAGRSAAREPVAGAVVEAILCVPCSYSTTAGLDGRYELVIPADYAGACAELTLRVTAEGYRPLAQTFLVNDLRAQPVQDLQLLRIPSRGLYLPAILR